MRGKPFIASANAAASRAADSLLSVNVALVA